MKDESETALRVGNDAGSAGGRINALLIAYHYFPENNGGVQRIAALKKYLPRYGVDVTLLTHRGKFGVAESERSDGVVRAFDITRHGMPLPVFLFYRVLQRATRYFGATGFRYTLWRRNAIRNAERLVRAQRPDVIVATYPPTETIEVALTISRRFGIPLVVDFRDGLVFEPLDPNLLKLPRIGRFVQSLDEQIIENAAAVVTVSEPISNYYRERQAARVETIANGFDPDELRGKTMPRPAAFRHDRINVVHTGRLGRSRAGTHIDAMLEALRGLGAEGGDRRLLFHFFGEYTKQEVKSLQPFVDQGVVLMHGLVSRDESLALQRHADVLLLVTAVGQRSIATGKLFEYLGAGKPILALTAGTEAEAIVRDTGAGWVVAPDDPGAIGVVLRSLVREGALDPLARRATRISAYERQEQGKRYADLLADVVRTHRRKALEGQESVS
ncbi:glycosyltransferase family 4 protein [Trinickia mobilis]|uniref:glycosyltransferase family 4 protein n=1 Tax=Trinickia mobilis TaxID=2816356 RepID=UPI001A8F93C6|nr:glycosyltransferase family 4 protein [Trinickia mobilis]